jgi:hypothetical protein
MIRERVSKRSLHNTKNFSDVNGMNFYLIFIPRVHKKTLSCDHTYETPTHVRHIPVATGKQLSVWDGSVKKKAAAETDAAC